MSTTVLTKNRARSALAIGVAAVDTTFVLTAGEGAKFPSPGAGQYCPIVLVDSAGNYEICHMTARSVDTLTVTRAQDGTAAQVWAIGTRVDNRIPAEFFNGIPLADQAETISGAWTHTGTVTQRGAITQQSAQNYATASGTPAYTATLSPALLAYTAGAEYKILFTNAFNSFTAPTLNLNTLGAKTIKLNGGAAVSPGDIIAGHQAILRYDGTDLILLNPARWPAYAGASPSTTIKNNATNPNYQLDIAADELILTDTNGYPMMLRNVSITGADADITTKLDTGAEGASTWYYIWVFAGGGSPVMRYSVSTSAPTAPAGYTHKARVGAVYNDGSSNFLRFHQIGKDVHYDTYIEALAGWTATAETSISLSAIVPPPPVSKEAFISADIGGQDVGGAVSGELYIRVVSGSNFQRISVRGSTGGGPYLNASFLLLPMLQSNYWYLTSFAAGANLGSYQRVTGFSLR